MIKGKIRFYGHLLLLLHLLAGNLNLLDNAPKYLGSFVHYSKENIAKQFSV